MRHQKGSSGASLSTKDSKCICCGNRSVCSGTETEDDEHEAITPESATIPLPTVIGKRGNLTPVMYWGPGSACSTPVSDMSVEDLEAAQTLLVLASGP